MSYISKISGLAVGLSVAPLITNIGMQTANVLAEIADFSEEDQALAALFGGVSAAALAANALPASPFVVGVKVAMITGAILAVATSPGIDIVAICLSRCLGTRISVDIVTSMEKEVIVISALFVGLLATHVCHVVVGCYLGGISALVLTSAVIFCKNYYRDTNSAVNRNTYIFRDAEFSKIPERTIAAEDNQDPISLSPLENPVLTSCGHLFSRESLVEWLDSLNVPHCPLDRQILTVGDIQSIERLVIE